MKTYTVVGTWTVTDQAQSVAAFEGDLVVELARDCWVETFEAPSALAALADAEPRHEERVLGPEDNDVGR